MANITLGDVQKFLDEFKVKARVFGIKYRDDRLKNSASMFALGINMIVREKIIYSIQDIDYSNGPIANTLNDDGDLWVFGKDHSGVEIYIKISLGANGAVCVSFHEAESPMSYPFKNQAE